MFICRANAIFVCLIGFTPILSGHVYSANIAGYDNVIKGLESREKS